MPRLASLDSKGKFKSFISGLHEAAVQAQQKGTVPSYVGVHIPSLPVLTPSTYAGKGKEIMAERPISTLSWTRNQHGLTGQRLT